MKKMIALAAVVFASSLSPLTAQTAPQPNPARESGGAAAGPLSADDRVMMRQRVMTRTLTSTKFEGDLKVGTELPATYRYYEIENEPRFSTYRYTRLNDRYVIVNRDNRVIEVFE